MKQKSLKIENLNRSIQNRFQVPAIACAIVDKDKVQYANGFGNVSIHHQQSVNEQTVFTLAFQRSRYFHSKLNHWQHDTFLSEWDDEYIPTGLLTFYLGQNKKIIGITLDQPNLLNVDFSELDVKTFQT